VPCTPSRPILVLAGRRVSARAIARFLLDCAVLLKHLLGDPRIAW
jgi:hypothetical protein